MCKQREQKKLPGLNRAALFVPCSTHFPTFKVAPLRCLYPRLLQIYSKIKRHATIIYFRTNYDTFWNNFLKYLPFGGKKKCG